MKKNSILSVLMGSLLLTAVSCQEDDLSNTSVVQVSETERTPLDDWLDVYYVRPYNIQVKYRYEYNEIDNGYFTVPADYEASVKFCHALKYACIDAYVENVGLEFTRTYFPKLFVLEGEFHYRNNGSYELGTAEGGKKITLMGLNHFDELSTTIGNLNKYFLHVIHHEFCHIMHQTVDYSPAYQLITMDYKIDKCFNTEFSDFLSRGYITAYAQKAVDEDFAEMYSNYVTMTEEEWEQALSDAEYMPLLDEDGNLQFNSDGTVVLDKNTKGNGRDLLEQKTKILRNYMQTTWNIDIDVMRASILSRERDIINGKIDLTSTDIK